MIIKNTDQFQLRASVRQYADDQYSLVLEQCWPVAKKPHWTTISQLNLSSAELDTLASVLIRK